MSCLPIALLIIVFSNVLSGIALADCFIYNGKYSSEPLAHFEPGGLVLYDAEDSYQVLAHIDENVIFKGEYGSMILAHKNPGKIVYDGELGTLPLAHLKKSNIVYQGAFGFNAIARARGRGCTDNQLLLGAAALKKLGKL